MINVDDRVSRRYGNLTHIYGTVIKVATTKCLVQWDDGKLSWHVCKWLMVKGFA